MLPSLKRGSMKNLRYINCDFFQSRASDLERKILNLDRDRNNAVTRKTIYQNLRYCRLMGGEPTLKNEGLFNDFLKWEKTL